MQTIDEPSLRGHRSFAGPERGAARAVAGCAHNVRFAAGETLFREGDAGRRRSTSIRHGSVALETFVPARGAVTIETLEPGEVVGWSWLFPPYRWHFDARALAPVRAIALRRRLPARKCERRPRSRL